MIELGSRHGGDRTWLIVVAASLWGFSSLLREPLAQQLPALAVVLAEHMVLALLVSPWWLSACRALVLCSTRTKLGVLVIGAGSSALATTLFCGIPGRGPDHTSGVAEVAAGAGCLARRRSAR